MAVGPDSLIIFAFSLPCSVDGVKASTKVAVIRHVIAPIMFLQKAFRCQMKIKFIMEWIWKVEKGQDGGIIKASENSTNQEEGLDPARQHIQ